jgi:hypothetical protein
MTGRRVVLVGLVALLVACGKGGGKNADDPLALGGKPSGACQRAFVDGHNREATGDSMAFVPSIQECKTLAEWTAAAHAFGVDLQGREAQFVDNVCNTATPDVKALATCTEARTAVNQPPPGR